MNSTVSLEVKYTPERGSFTVTVHHYEQNRFGSVGMIEREDQLQEFVVTCADELYSLALEMRGVYDSDND